MTVDALAMLELLEQLLSLTERFKDSMERKDRINWHLISAAAADFREVVDSE